MEASDPNIKQVTVIQPVVTEGGSRRQKKTKDSRVTTQKVHKEKEKIPPKKEGGGTSPGTLTQLASTSVPGPLTDPVGVNSVVTQKGAPIGGSVKVVLQPKKKQTKVLLAAAAPKTANKTRRVARKIRMSTAGLGKKMTRAKTIRQDATKLSLEAIKKDLVKAGLVKADSKAPEEILRQIYSDYMMLKKKAL
jgi:hypothetical protein